MYNPSLVKQLRQDSGTIDQLFAHPEDRRHLYNSFVLGASEQLWGRQLSNGKRFDANSSLALYELSLSIDQRVIEQAVEQSYLRKNFDNFKDESILDEYTGIDPASSVYVPLQMEESGFDRTSANSSSRIKPSTNPNEIKTIKAAISPIRRDVLQFQEGFELTLADLELAAMNRLPLQQNLATRVARDLMMEEQWLAFNYQAAGANVAPEGQGLLYNTAISTAIIWTAGALLAAGTTGRAIVDEFVRIRGAILQATTGIFEEMGQPLCVMMSIANRNALTRTFSDLEGRSAMSYLTEREFRIIGVPSLTNSQSFFYYKDPMNIEISTARRVEAQPQSYEAKKTSWFFPFRIVTAGVTVKRKEAIYSVSGMNP
jgi:hypothetical protein